LQVRVSQLRKALGTAGRVSVERVGALIDLLGLGEFTQLLSRSADASVPHQVDDLSVRDYSETEARRICITDWPRVQHDRGDAAMSVSDKFGELKERIEKADREIQAAAAENQAELKGAVEKARKSADDRAAELRTKSKDTSDETNRLWLDALNDWNGHVKRIRARMDATKADLNIAMAAQDASDDETDAVDAIDFASSAVAEAEYAVLNALRSEKRVEALKESMAQPS